MKDHKRPSKPWREVNVYSKGDDGRFHGVFDLTTKAKVLKHYRDTSNLPEGYTFLPLHIVEQVKDYGDDPVIHALSVLWWKHEEDGTYARILDPITIRDLSGMLKDGKPLPKGCSTLNVTIDFDGIEEKSKPFNAPRYKLSQTRD